MQRNLETEKFKNKVAVVTGGAGGIGKNIVRAFAQESASVIVCDVDEEKCRKTKNELQKQDLSVEILSMDLSQPGAPQDLIQKVFQKYKRIDILINNARSPNRTDLFGENENTWDQGMSVMLKAPFFSSREAIQVMSKTGGGSIINISSIAALLVGHDSPTYHIAKAGLIQMTRYLATYAGGYGIRVNCLLPGFIIKDEHVSRYNRDDNQRYREIAEFCHPLGHTGSSVDVTNAVQFLCSPEASFITGQALVVDGGLTLQDQSGLLFRFYQEMKNTERIN